MSSAISSVIKSLPVSKSYTTTVSTLFTTKSHYPFISFPFKPTNISSISFSSSFCPSLISVKDKISRSGLVPFVAQTTNWTEQEDGDAEVDSWGGEVVDGEVSFVDGVSEGDEGSYTPSPSEEAKLYVGNLPYDVDSQQLAEFFNQAGVVEVAEVIYNRETDQSKGFAFVTMSTVEEAEKAIEMLNGHDLNGRFLRVNKAAAKGSRLERTPRVYEPSFKIYVGNLPWQVDDARLEQVFSEHGKVVNARVVIDRETSRSRGFGFVTMGSEIELNDAIAALDGQSLDGRAIRVNVAADRPRGSF